MRVIRVVVSLLEGSQVEMRYNGHFGKKNVGIAQRCSKMRNSGTTFVCDSTRIGAKVT